MKSFRIGWACAIVAALGTVVYFQFSIEAPADKNASTHQAMPAVASPNRFGRALTPYRANIPAGAEIHGFTNVDERAFNAWIACSKEDPSLREFATWVEKVQRGDRTATEKQGVALAERRGEQMAELIQTDPQRALELAMPKDLIAALPSRIAALTEQHVAGWGRLAVLGAIPESTSTTNFVSTFRVATTGGTQYKAFAYGQRLGQPTRDNILLHGIAMKSATRGHLLAVHESPARLLGNAEVAQLKKSNGTDPLCAISGLPSMAKNTQTVLDADGEPVFACGLDHALILQKQIAAADGENAAPGGADAPQASAYTEGQKRLLLIRVDFPDLPGEPLTELAGLQLVTNINNFWADASYGKVTVSMPGQGFGESSDVTPTLRLTNSASYFGANNYYDELRVEARVAAEAAGFYRTNYDFDVICIGSVPGFNWRGLGYVGVSGAWIRNSFATGTLAHELGHNLGLNHASFWDTAGTSAIGPGASVEYGDGFDVMGSDGSGRPYHARYRAFLNWLTANDVATFSTNGIYRIMAYDVTNSTGVRALKIVRNTGNDSTNQYWLEYHAVDRATAWELAGAELRWAGSGNQKSQLIDTTPGSPPGLSDVPIAIGRTFVDSVFNIYITPLRKAGTTPESIDIFVFKGTVSSNLAPTLSISTTTTNPALYAPVTFAATGSDPNGDSLAYHWDFGDGSFGTNGNVISKSWDSDGEHVVLCTVTDMKGGEARSRLIVRVDSPATYRISGRVLNDGTPVQGVRVFASSTRVTYTDSDGYYDLVNLGAGSYTVGAVLENYTFTNRTFINPVAVGPNAQNIDFISDPPYYALPKVEITNPLPDAIVGEGSNVLISATTSATVGKSITSVEFFVGDILLAKATTAPYSVTWSNAIFGTYALTARAVDSAGMVTTSAPVTLAISRTIFSRGSVWKYLDDGSDQGTNWMLPGFDDNVWASGAGRFGYGGDGEVTTVSYGPNANAKHITTYFRRTFDLPPGTIVSNLILRITRDDGVAVYSDGVEAFRDNIFADIMTYRTLASATVTGADETNFVEVTVSGSILATNASTHLIAAEVHQNAVNSDDLGFDLELLVTGSLVPRLTVQRTGSEVRLSWPAMAGSWNLYAATSADRTAEWTEVTVPATIVNGLKTVLVPAPALSEFYRLQNP